MSPNNAPPTSASAGSAHDRRQRRVLIGVALMFFAPLGVAFFLYYGHGTWHPGGRVNAGELIEPPRPLPSLALPLVGSGETKPDFLLRKWTFLQVEPGVCSRACLTDLYETRQIRIALDRDMSRVQRVFIADEACCDLPGLREQHPDLIVIRHVAATAPLLSMLSLLPSAGHGDAGGIGAPSGGVSPGAVSGDDARRVEGIYLIDPLGNLMMHYPAGAKPKGILEDIKRLLRLSSIG